MFAFVPYIPVTLTRSCAPSLCKRRPRMSSSTGEDKSAQVPPENETKNPERNVLQPPPIRRTGAPEADVQSVQSKVQLQSSLLTAMRDYFGDDGREADDFCKRPTTDDGTPMFRILIVGSGERELALAKSLAECDCVMGLYYTPPVPNTCDVRFADYATSTGTATDDPDGFLSFAQWALVDAIFVGPDFPGAVPKDVEAKLANEAITVFPHDVSAAVADGTLDPAVCLAPLGDELPDADAVIVGAEFGDNLNTATAEDDSTKVTS